MFIGSLAGAAVEAREISVVCAVVLTPLVFTGATFYPWAALDGIRWSRASR
jgi:ABC-2 type transport system permease protein